MKTCTRKCSTCIFSADSPVDAERFRDLERTWTKVGNESAQVCHKFQVGNRRTRLTPDSVICRGYLDAARRGRYTLPSVLQVCERLGLITEVEPPDD